MDDNACPACRQPFIGHWQCAICYCFGHKNAQARDKAICRDCDAALARRGYRRCTKCEAVKPVRSFRRTRTWVRRTCDTCRSRLPSHRAYHRRWEAKNRETRREQRKANRARNVEKYRAQGRRYYAKHRPRRGPSVNAYIRAWRRRNVEKVRSYQAAYRARRLVRILRGTKEAA